MRAPDFAITLRNGFSDDITRLTKLGFSYLKITPSLAAFG